MCEASGSLPTVRWGNVERPGESCSVHRTFASFPVRCPDLELLQLAGGRASKLLASLHRCRALEVRKMLAAVIDQLLLAGSGARLQHHQGFHGLAPLLV